MILEIPDQILQQDRDIRILFFKMQLVGTGLFGFWVDEGLLYLRPSWDREDEAIEFYLVIDEDLYEDEKLGLQWYQRAEGNYSPRGYGDGYDLDCPIYFEELLELVSPDLRVKLLFHLDLFAGNI